MAFGFRLLDDGRLRAVLDEQEQELLLHLARDIREFLAPQPTDDDPFGLGILESADISDDPALARLFPDAYDFDVDAADDFRRYTESDLRHAKIAHLDVLIDSIRGAAAQDITVTVEQARDWMVALNDVRLVIGTRLHLDDEEEPDLEPVYVEQLTAIYQWLTWLQESLVGALVGD